MNTLTEAYYDRLDYEYDLVRRARNVALEGRSWQEYVDRFDMVWDEWERPFTTGLARRV